MDPLVIPVIALAIPFFAIPASLIAKHHRRARELEHLERMQALSVGRELPGDAPWWSPGRISVAIGVAVPLGAMSAAAAATESVGFQREIWMTAAMVGLGGVLSGGMLAYKSISQPSTIESAPAKPSYDPDSFDVVGSRG